jgi:phosphoribosylformimino-5-aminoimidazole carboxamide ribotide isomerase
MDGKLGGASVDLYKNILNQFPQIQLIASGGVATINDVIELKNMGCKGVIIGKAIYENRIALQDLMDVR